MEELKELLDLSQLTSRSKIEERFDTIAKKLLFEYEIVKSEKKKYDILNVEFYYCSKDFPDICTYPRNCEAGKWFIHNSGFDLTFKSNSGLDSDKDNEAFKRDLLSLKDNEIAVKEKIGNKYYGGILIRYIKRQDSEVIIDGPLKSEYELFDMFDAFGGTRNIPILKQRDKALVIKDNKTTRHNIDDKNTLLYFADKQYRFYVGKK